MSFATRLGPLAALLLLVGCGATDAGSGSAGGGDHRAVASFYPLAWVTEQVAGDEWEVTNLTSPGGEPHDLGLDIARTAAVEEADVVVFQRGFQPAVDEAVDNVATGIRVDAAAAVELIPTGATPDQGDVDPHFWLDPLLMAELADAVAGGLGEADPEEADTYAANADALRTRLEELDAAYTEGLAECERDTVVVSHDAFGYLARYGLTFESIAGLSPDAEPTPAVLAHLQELIEAEGITTVFSERLASPAMAESLASDAGVDTAVLDPVEGPAEAAADSDYVALMEQNLEALKAANGC